MLLALLTSLKWELQLLFLGNLPELCNSMCSFIWAKNRGVNWRTSEGMGYVLWKWTTETSFLHYFCYFLRCFEIRNTCHVAGRNCIKTWGHLEGYELTIRKIRYRFHFSRGSFSHLPKKSRYQNVFFVNWETKTKFFLVVTV